MGWGTGLRLGLGCICAPKDDLTPTHPRPTHHLHRSSAWSRTRSCEISSCGLSTQTSDPATLCCWVGSGSTCRTRMRIISTRSFFRSDDRTHRISSHLMHPAASVPSIPHIMHPAASIASCRIHRILCIHRIASHLILCILPHPSHPSHILCIQPHPSHPAASTASYASIASHRISSYASCRIHPTPLIASHESCRMHPTCMHLTCMHPTCMQPIACI